MNLPAGWQEATATSTLLLAFLVLVGASLVVLFLAPFFFKLAKKAKFPARLGFIKRHPKRSLAAVLVVLIAIFGACVYYYFSQPVRIVSAAQFKLEKGGAISELQQRGFSSWEAISLLLLDVRSRQEYATEHLKGSASSPVEIAVREVYPKEEVDIVVYSAASRFDEARKTADSIKKNGNLVKDRYKERVGKIYVIRDGFEGLKKAGLATEVGIWD